VSAYRVSTEVIGDDGKTTKVSFIVESGWVPGWKWAVEQAHQHLAGVQVTGDVSVDQVWPEHNPQEG
jgi:hypothetical protein